MAVAVDREGRRTSFLETGYVELLGSRAQFALDPVHSRVRLLDPEVAAVGLPGFEIALGLALGLARLPSELGHSALAVALQIELLRSNQADQARDSLKWDKGH